MVIHMIRRLDKACNHACDSCRHCDSGSRNVYLFVVGIDHQPADRLRGAVEIPEQKLGHTRERPRVILIGTVIRTVRVE